jgi:polyhydroxyalkanoate synthesis regulator phasin
MIETIKKTLLAGLGATVITAERVEQSLSGLVEKGKINAEEAREAAKKVVDQGKEEWENSRQDMAESIEKILKKANFASRDALDKLSARVDELEAKLAEKSDD